MASIAPRPEARRRSRRLSMLDTLADLPVSIAGLVLVFGGAVLQMIAILSSTWLTGVVGKAEVSYGFADFGARTQRGIAYIYFSYGAWFLVAMTFALGIAACVRWRWAQSFRFVGAIIGVLAAIVTIIAVLEFASQSAADVFQVAGNYSIGVYLAVLGLLAGAFGAAAGGAVPTAEM